MKDLEIYQQRGGSKVDGVVDLGEWDLSAGYEGTIFIKNPNPHAKADLRGITNRNAKLEIDLPEEIQPLDTATVYVRIAGQSFDTEQEEQFFFDDILDNLSGKVKWVKP